MLGPDELIHVVRPRRRAGPHLVTQRRLGPTRPRTSTLPPVLPHRRLERGSPSAAMLDPRSWSGLALGCCRHGVSPMDEIGLAALKLNPRLELLSPFIGTWRTTGSHPMMPGQVLQGRTSFAWHQGGAFVI